MKYNLAEQAYVYPNTTSGNVYLDGAQVNGLLIDPSTYVVTISGANGDILVVDCNLNDRTAIEELRYYFSSATASGTIANTITFQYKDDTPDTYSPLSTQIGPGYYYATITSGVSAPRYVRLTHTVSGTVIVGDVKAFYVVNNDEEIDFGVDGNTTSKNLLASAGSDFVVPVGIFNDSVTSAIMYAMLEATGENTDDIMAISTDEDGDFYGPVVNAEVIADADTWDVGKYDNTSLDVDDRLVLTNPAIGSGTYITRISNNTAELKRYHIKAEIPGDSMITTVSGNYYEVIEVRESGVKPLNYAYYSTLAAEPYAKLYIDDYWVYDQSLKSRSASTLHSTGSASANSGFSEEDMYMYIDNVSELKAGTFSYDSEWNYTAFVDLFRYTESDVVTTFRINYSSTYNDAPVTIPYWMKTDSVGGVWFYFYSVYYAAGRFVDATGYYLTYFDDTLTNRVKIFNYNDVYNQDLFDVDYDNNELWYCNQATDTINRMDISGAIIFSYIENANDVKDLISDGEGGIWYINKDILYHVNSIGDELSSTAFPYTKIAYCNETTIWGMATNKVDNVYLDTGAVKFSVQVMYADAISSVLGGVYVETSVDELVYIDLGSREVRFTLDNVYYRYGFMDVPFDKSGFKDNFPIAVDPVWNSTLSWKEVNYYKYILDSALAYQQLKITLRSDSTGLLSPLIDSIHLQRAIKVQGIQAQYYKNVYVKIENPLDSDIGVYTPKLLVWKEELV